MRWEGFVVVGAEVAPRSGVVAGSGGGARAARGRRGVVAVTPVAERERGGGAHREGVLDAACIGGDDGVGDTAGVVADVAGGGGGTGAVVRGVVDLLVLGDGVAAAQLLGGGSGEAAVPVGEPEGGVAVLDALAVGVVAFGGTVSAPLMRT